MCSWASQNCILRHRCMQRASQEAHVPILMLPFEPDLDHTMGPVAGCLHQLYPTRASRHLCARHALPANWEMRPHRHVSCMHEGKHAFLRFRVAKAHWGLRTLQLKQKAEGSLSLSLRHQGGLWLWFVNWQTPTDSRELSSDLSWVVRPDPKAQNLRDRTGRKRPIPWLPPV